MARLTAPKVATPSRSPGATRRLRAGSLVTVTPPRTARFALALALLLPGLLSAAPAGAAPPPLESAGKTANIQLVSSTQESGYSWNFYRNLDYPCSISGHQTFAVGRRTGSSDSAPAPLWVRMRGGGVGYFDASGKPQPSAGNKTENDATQLIRFATGNDLNARVSAEPAGFRTVSVSMCSHDIYAGGDQPDPNNPDPSRTVNGLFATKAAIQFVQDRYPTGATFLHGTSAGSYGSWHVAWSLERQGRPVTGVVADSGANNLRFEADQNAQSGPCARGGAVDAVFARVHPEIGRAGQPERLLARAALSAPVLNVWSRDDRNSCGETEMSCTLPDGSVRVLGAMECRMEPVGQAIAALPASRRSVNMRLCVRPRRGPADSCALHVVTTPASVPNTDPAFPADYNTAIVEWVRELLGSPGAAALPVRFGSGRAVVRRARLRVRCVAGGSGPRSCRVSVRRRLGGGRGRPRLIASGRGAIASGGRSTVVTLRLNRAGRRALASSPGPRGLRVRIGARVSQTGGALYGVYSRRLRLLR